MEQPADIKTLLEKEIALAEKEVARLKRTYATYIGADADAPVLMTQKNALPPSTQRTDLAPLVHDVLPTIPVGKNFKAEDIFRAFGRDDLNYERVRSGLAARLGKLAEDGKLEKVARGIFRRPADKKIFANNNKEG